MVTQLELIAGTHRGEGCNVSNLPCADTWMVNIRLGDNEKFPFVSCDRCTRSTCYRRRYR
jgi:hypothetical protein